MNRQQKHLAEMRRQRMWVSMACEAFVVGDLTFDEFKIVLDWLFAEGLADREGHGTLAAADAFRSVLSTQAAKPLTPQ